MKNLKIKVCLHPTKFNSKDQANKFVGKVTNELPKCVKELYFVDFVKSLGKGQTWCGGIFDPQVKKAKNWKAQQVFAIDVDNNDGKNISPIDLINHYENKGFPPNASYHSLSSKPNQLKYRLIWVVDEIITDPLIAVNFKRWLIKNSKNLADTCTINLDRLYFGGQMHKIYHFETIKDIPQRKGKQFNKKTYKITPNTLNLTDIIPELTRVSTIIENPIKKYGTRYKAYFYCSIFLTRGTNGGWSPTQIYDYLLDLRKNNPNVWSNYHYEEEDIYKWTEAAYNWTLEEFN